MQYIEKQGMWSREDQSTNNTKFRQVVDVVYIDQERYGDGDNIEDLLDSSLFLR